MAVYFANTEITGIKDLFPLSSKDITGLYFADTELFTVWGTYDGTLPAQYSANGSMLSDYRVYGASGGVGDRTVNLFDYTTITSTVGKYLNENGAQISSAEWAFTDYIPVEGNTFTLGKIGGNAPSVCLYDENKQFISGAAYNSGGASTKVNTTVTGSNAKFARFSYYRVSSPNQDDLSKIMLVEGSTAPEEYVPFGYEVDMSVSDGTTSTTTPIYIGGEPLEEDEYVDYGKQKVYRRTENLFNKANAEIGSIYISGPSIGDDYPSTTAIRSDYIDVTPGKTYYVNAYNDFYFQYCAGYNGSNFVKSVVENTTPIPKNQVITIPANVNNLRLIFRKANVTPYPEVEDTNLINVTFTEGSTAPSTYIPYLQPEDLPVPLPALPTVDGVNVVDYAGQSVAVPSRFMAKYRKEGFN